MDDSQIDNYNWDLFELSYKNKDMKEIIEETKIINSEIDNETLKVNRLEKILSYIEMHQNNKLNDYFNSYYQDVNNLKNRLTSYNQRQINACYYKFLYENIYSIIYNISFHIS